MGSLTSVQESGEAAASASAGSDSRGPGAVLAGEDREVGFVPNRIRGGHHRKKTSPAALCECRPI